MNKLRLDDEVIVIAGKDKKKTGKLKSIFWNQGRVVVEGVNIIKKAIKPSQEKPDGGFVEMEAPINISNVQVVSPKTGKGTRVRIVEENGKKKRVAVSCGSDL